MHARYVTKQMAQLMYQQKSLMRKVEEMHLLEEMVQVREMVHMRGKEMQEVRMEEMVQEVKEEMVQEVREEEMEEMEMEEMEVNLIQREKRKEMRKRMRKSRIRMMKIPMMPETPAGESSSSEETWVRQGYSRDDILQKRHQKEMRRKTAQSALKALDRHYRRTLTKPK